jgi:hypothetical protein
MPVQHLVVITFSRELTHDEQQSLLKDANALKTAITEILDLKCGIDMGLNGTPGKMFSLTATFDSKEAYVTYQTHLVHQEFISKHIKPVMADRKAVQFEFSH